jgi:putative NIF3 family GTP cyclohydrolase 1 type 2
MPTVQDIIRHVEELSGHELNKDEGVWHGNADTEVTGATVAWTAAPEAIRGAAESGHELLIVHESLYYPYNVQILPNPRKGWEDWPVNKGRRERLEQCQLTCLRIHGSADEICIFDTFAELLGLGEPVAAQRLAKVFEIPECRVAELTQHVKERIGMHAVRVAGDPDTRVHRVGLPWGGLGLDSNVGYQQKLVAQGCDVFIAGEADNMGFRFAVESGIPMIETSHELSENPGLRVFTDMLAKAFSDVKFVFHELPCVWRME